MNKEYVSGTKGDQLQDSGIHKMIYDVSCNDCRNWQDYILVS